MELDSFKEKYEAIKDSFNSAVEDGDESKMAKAWDDYDAFETELDMEGQDFKTLFKAYQAFRLRGNTGRFYGN